jgi:outer membrane protein assembly factor BamB
VTASGSSSLSYQWQKGTTPISGATSASYTTPATTASDSGSQFSVVVNNSGIKLTSSSALLTVKPATDVLTHHNDVARTGQNLTESILTISNVNSTEFGKLGFFPMDGLVENEPLYVSNVAVPNNGTHNLVFAGTEHGTVYALDADSGTTIWKVSTLKPGESPSDEPYCPGCRYEIGVNATPVIDRSGGSNGLIYVVASSKDGSGNYHQRLHALDLALGTEMLGGPVEIQATYPGTGDNSDGTNVIFDAMQYRERSALLLLNGVVYTTWASHFDARPYTGWIIGYSASSLSQASVLNVTPNGSDGAIWMSGAGPAADSSGNIYLLDANGVFDSTLNSSGFPSAGDYGNAFIKLSTSGNRLAVADYFESNDGTQQSDLDSDLGSGGAMVLPDLNDSAGHTVHLAIGAGKDSNLYVINRDSMGKYDPQNNNIYQELDGVLPGGVFAMPAYFYNTVYFGPVGSTIRAFTIANAKLSSSPVAQSSNWFGYPGVTPSISANGTKNAILWAVEGGPTAVLRAYDAATLNELYDSNQAGSRDQLSAYSRFVTPTIANGRVFVQTATGVAVFGLLPKQMARAR